MEFVFKNLLSKKDFNKLKKEIQHSHFQTETEQGIDYPNISLALCPDIFKKILGNNIKIKKSFTRAYNSNHKNPSYVHTDAFFSDYIGIFFIQKNKEETTEDAGVKIWKHKELGTHSITKNMFNDITAKLVNESTDVSNWEIFSQHNFEENKFIAFPASYFHSKGSPENKGEDILTSRIVHVIFFDKE